MNTIKRDFNSTSWIIIPAAIAINIAVGSLITFLKLPLYLDSIGTVMVGVLAGPWAGALTGLLSNLIWALFPNYRWLAWYVPVAAIVGYLAGVWAEKGWFSRAWRVIIAGLVTGTLAALISAPITTLTAGEVTGTGQDYLVAAFRDMGANVLEATLGQGLVADPVDKTISFLVVLLVVRDLPHRILERFPRSESVRGGESA